MLRAIIKRKFRDSVSGASGSTMFTLDFQCEELEKQLNAGGFGEAGYEIQSLVGIEVIRDCEHHWQIYGDAGKCSLCGKWVSRDEALKGKF